MTMVKTVLFLGGLGAAIATCARVSTPPVKPPAPASSASVAVPVPIRAAVFGDRTKSMMQARVLNLTPADFAPLFERLRTSGGEIAFGLICDQSNRPLIRLYAPPPPEPPAAVPSVPGNVFAAANTRRRDDAERKKYEAARKAWLADTAERIKVFLAAITPLLAEPDDAMHTDVRSAIVRADLFLAEPSPFGRNPECVVVLISDGIDNVNTEPLPSLKSKAQVVIANGVGSAGAVEALSPVPFEAVSAAMRYVAARGQYAH